MSFGSPVLARRSHEEAGQGTGVEPATTAMVPHITGSWGKADLSGTTYINKHHVGIFGTSSLLSSTVKITRTRLDPATPGVQRERGHAEVIPS
jgi:hypothetical protein